MERITKCKKCGVEFTAVNNHQYYCSLECKREAEKDRRRKRAEPRTKAPSTAICDMVELMMMLSKERGYTVQYGEVQRELLTGRLKLNGGVSDG